MIEKNSNTFVEKVVKLFIKWVGFNFIRRVAKLFGNFIFYFIPIRKSVVLSNLSIAFPEKSKKELLTIARKSYESIMITFTELLLFPYLSSEFVKSQFTLLNMDMIDRKYKEGKGLIFWTGHFGSWEMGAMGGSLVLGYPFYVLAKKQSNQAINDYLTKAREAHGNKMVWLGPSVKQLFLVLKKGGVLGIVGDQRGPQNSIRVNFFGRPTAFYTGTAQIIEKTNCNVVFGAIARTKNYKYVGDTEELDLSLLPKDSNEKIRAINQSYALFLEKYIRIHPEQYFWMHNLWKY